MSERPKLRILVVDDDTQIVMDTKELLENQPVSDTGDMATVTTSTNFDEALTLLAEDEFDLIVLDVRDQRLDESSVEPDASGSDVSSADLGIAIYEQVRAMRFIPIIFYTALPGLVEEEASPGAPFVGLVSKTDDDPSATLRLRVREVFNSTLPAIHRALLEHVERVVRDFMGGFVQQHWSELSTPPRKGDMAHLLLRRLSLSLADGVQVLMEELSAEAISLDEDTVHPMRYYIIPPTSARATGDIVRISRRGGDAGEREETIDNVGEETLVDDWYVILTPACDLQPARLKADYVMLATCLPLKDRAEVKEFIAKNPAAGQVVHQKSYEDLKKLMRNGAGQADRFVYLPAAWGLPDLLIDLQQVVCIKYERLDAYECVASLDSPYAEWIVQKFVRHLGRIGVPDLDVDTAIARLRSAL